MKHDELLESAKDAASKLHGDMSVSKRTTVESLRDLIDHISSMIDATESDISKD